MIHIRLVHCVQICLLASIVAIGIGCSADAPAGKIEGTVSTSKGPIATGVVNFYNAESGNAAMATIKDGQFQLEGELPPGSYAVYITPPPPSPPNPDTPPTPPVTLDDVPKSYQTAESTPWKKDIVAGQNTLELTVAE